MALVKCRECGREVSNRAKRCPGCGTDKPHISLSEWIVGGAFWVFVGYVVYWLVTQNP